ncbi:MAG: NAD(P)H-hydrate dehydratase [Ghiorsea sp.]|nr:NAD(P)H-hydrate dehydratase [Ghiorsea sp.]
MKQPCHILTAKQMFAADQATITAGQTSLKLMERAGQAILPLCHQLKLDAGRVVIIVGQGHNGGDGFVAARLLRVKNVPVTVIPLIPIQTLQGDAAIQAKLAQEAGVKIRPATCADDLPALQAWLHRAVIIVDAIFGIGLNKPIQGWIAQAIQAINVMDRPILSVDIASGIDADTGEVLGAAIQATATIPIAAYKWGHWLQQGHSHSGHIFMPANIGIDAKVIQQVQQQFPADATSSLLINDDVIAQAITKRDTQAHKQTSGHVWVFGGSIGYTGAPKLAAMGAQAIGAGLVSIACPNDVYPIIAASSLEVMVHPQEHALWQQADAIIAGMGWNDSQQNTLHQLLQHHAPLVLDAGALNILCDSQKLQTALQQRKAFTVLTPHPGEAARLLHTNTTDIQKNRLKSALELAETYQTWVVLKGAQTLIASPQKQVWLNPFGSANLAVAGTGDVLAGIIGGLLANQSKKILPLEQRMLAAVAIHGLIGEQNNWYRAGQLPSQIAQYIAKLHQET